MSTVFAVVIRRRNRLRPMDQDEVTVPSDVRMAMDSAAVSVRCVYGHSRR
jgi:hypothetical protein